MAFNYQIDIFFRQTEMTGDTPKELFKISYLKLSYDENSFYELGDEKKMNEFETLLLWTKALKYRKIKIETAGKRYVSRKMHSS